MSHSLKSGALLISVLLLFSFSGPMAHAADSTPALAPNGPQPEAQERIEVTGSHIKRIDTEGVAPVATVSHKQLEEKGYNSLGDVVRDIGANSFGGSNGSPGNSTTPGYQDISLRGLGSDNTLVLLNGQRLPADAQNGAVDLNLIPMAAVDHIEILKDGASAVYGSDALGGVVNVITKKDFQGTEMGLTQTVPVAAGGKQTDLSLVNGINGEKFNVVTAINYRYNQPVFSRDRSWSKNNLSTLGNPGSYKNADPNTGKTTGSVIASQYCPADLLYTDAVGNTYCRYRYSDQSEEAPQIGQIGGLSELHYELDSTWRIAARAMITHRDATTIAAPPPGDGLYIPNAMVPAGTPGLVTGDDLNLYFRVNQLGNRVTDVVTDSYNGMVSATAQLPKDWALDLTTSYNLINGTLTGTNGFALQPSLQDLINNGTYRPLSYGIAQGDPSSAKYNPTEVTQSKLMGFEVKASGDLAEMDAGPLSLAVGSSVNYASYLDQADAQTLAGNVIGDAGGSGGGHRTFEALYAEMSLPLIKKTLELQLAGRYDRYSDFGSSTNPKIGFLYHANKEFMFRGSWGTGFRAPLLTELYAGQSIGYPSFIDHYGCDHGYGGCSAAQYLTTSSSNSALSQETSNSFTLGGIYEPTTDLNFGTDWFYTATKGQPGFDYNDMTTAEDMGLGTTKVNSSGKTVWSDQGATITRNSDGTISSVYAPLENLSQTQEAGVDITASYRYEKWKLSTEQNQLFFYRTSGFPGVALTDKLGWNGNPSWRNMTQLGYLLGFNQSLTLTAFSIPGQQDLARTGRIGSFTSFDLGWSLQTKSYGAFTVSVINMFSSQPPKDFSNTAPVNYTLYDPNGTQFVFGYKYKI